MIKPFAKHLSRRLGSRPRPAALAPVLLTALAFGMAACSSASHSTTNQHGPVVITTRDTSYGRVLTTGSGTALYSFSLDVRSSTSNCPRGPCTDLWPPLVDNGKVVASDGVQRSLIGSIHRPGGTVQVTYAGWPLYTFTTFSGPGQVGGQHISQFGGYWYLMHASGHRVLAPAP
ncbi:MAG: COG4315 family predicted lipoprotein [Acidimicrobiales bacterium]